MATPHVVTALQAKRTELVQHVDALQAELRQVMIDLDHVDSTLRMFDPDTKLEPLKHRLPPATKRAQSGEISRVVLSLLRTEGPLDSQEVTRRIMEQRGQNPDDKPLFATSHSRIGNAMRGLRKRGSVKSEYGDKGLLVWSVTH